MSKIILFNAPKAVGKDVAIKHLSTPLVLNYAECKQILHTLTMTLFGVTSARYWEIYNNRELKETPLPDFFVCMTGCYEDFDALEEVLGYSLHGTHLDDPVAYKKNWELRFKDHPEEHYSTALNLSIREAMIYVSEIIIKPRWGDNYFGVARVKSIKDFESLQTYPEPLFVDGSCAFVEELEPLIEYLGQENILLLRIHRDGFTFEGDSRNYIPDGVITNTIDIYNNGTEQEYFDKVQNEVIKWLNISV